jgi:endogenous inhibitor of DNA gyrase (YacG/DUF329 family)
VKPRADNSAFPFCSPTCKLVDLDRWLSGTYRVDDASLEADGTGGDERAPRPPTEDE